jgi:hypothetical protein
VGDLYALFDCCRVADLETGLGWLSRSAGLTELRDYRPHEQALALLVVPWMDMIGDPQALEAGSFGAHGLTNQIIGREFFAGQEVAQ